MEQSLLTFPPPTLGDTQSAVIVHLALLAISYKWNHRICILLWLAVHLA